MFANLTSNRGVRAEGYSQSQPYLPADKLVQSVQTLVDTPEQVDITGAPQTYIFSPVDVGESQVTLIAAKRPLVIRGFAYEDVMVILSDVGSSLDFWFGVWGWFISVVRAGDSAPSAFNNPLIYPPAVTDPDEASWSVTASDDMTAVVMAGLYSGSQNSAPTFSFNRPVTIVLNESDSLVLTIFPLPYRPTYDPPTDEQSAVSIIDNFYITN